MREVTSCKDDVTRVVHRQGLCARLLPVLESVKAVTVLVNALREKHRGIREKAMKR